jgi:hypothetical protein
VRASNEFFNTHVVHVSFLLYLVNSDGLVIVLSAEVFTGLFLSGGEGSYIAKIFKLTILIYVLTNASRSGNTPRDLACSGHLCSPPLLGTMLTRVAMVGNSLFVVVLGLCGEVRIGVTTDGQGCENLV